MIHTNGLHRPREKTPQNKEATSLSTCNGTRTFPHDQPNSSPDSDVHHSTKDKHVRRKEKKETCAHEGEDLVHVMSDAVTHGRTPAMCDQGSNNDITAVVHTGEKEQHSPGGKCAKGTVHGCCDVGGSTDSSDMKTPAAEKNAESSPNGHSYSSPPKLEKETSPPKCSNNECSPPENCGDLAESKKQVCADDKEEVRQKPIDDVANETESCMKSVHARKGNCCHDVAGDDRGSSCDVDLQVKSINENQSSKKKVKDSRNESLSLLIERMQGNISQVTSNEDVESVNDNDESESIDDESDVNSSGSSESDDSSSEEGNVLSVNCLTESCNIGKIQQLWTLREGEYFHSWSSNIKCHPANMVTWFSLVICIIINVIININQYNYK